MRVQSINYQTNRATNHSNNNYRNQSNQLSFMCADAPVIKTLSKGKARWYKFLSVLTGKNYDKTPINVKQNFNTDIKKVVRDLGVNVHNKTAEIGKSGQLSEVELIELQQLQENKGLKFEEYATHQYLGYRKVSAIVNDIHVTIAQSALTEDIDITAKKALTNYYAMQNLSDKSIKSIGKLFENNYEINKTNNKTFTFSHRFFSNLKATGDSVTNTMQKGVKEISTALKVSG